MMKMNKITLLTTTLLIIYFIPANAQYTTLNAHSHNDYSNKIPFWLAYNNHFGSIEADIWAVNGDLIVAHNSSELKPENSLGILYLDPIISVFGKNKGSAWQDQTSTFQLLIDLKTTTEPTLSILIEKLKQHPEVFDPSVNKNAVRIVITGNRPDPGEFGKYPDFISFDGLLKMVYDDHQKKRVPLYSENLRNIISWDGAGEIPVNEKTKLQNVIDSIHSLNKKIRFWNAPDNTMAWKTLMEMHADYLNTDHITELSEYLNKQVK
jgi:alkaline phosphatase